VNSKQVAISAAKQVARESNEFLKVAREQIAPMPEFPQKENSVGAARATPSSDVEQKPKNLGFLDHYKGELEQIRRDDLFKKLQRKIAEGEEIPLEDFITQLSSEQREVLKAQMEAVRMQKERAQNAQEQESPLHVIAKKGRNAMMGMFKKKNETHVETRQPPSG
jgi:hypothetical protein